MEKRFIYAFVLSLLFIVGYNAVIPKFFPKPATVSPTPRIEPVLPESVQPVSIVPVPHEEPVLTTVSIGEYSVTYSARGGYIKNLRLNKYNEELKFHDIGFIVDLQNVVYQPTVQGNRLIFTAQNGERKEFTFAGYELTIRLSTKQYPVLLFSNTLSAKPIEHGYQEFFAATADGIKRMNFKKVKDGTFADVSFAGSRDQFYSASLLPGTYTISVSYDKAKQIVMAVLLPPQKEFTLYVGPQIAHELAPLGLASIISYGLFHWIGVALVWILTFFYGLTKSWGVSIILLTIITYIVLFPFTMQSTKAMRKMAAMQPELNEIKAKYKDNLKKAQEEQAKLFKKHGVNPIGGCLPYLFQMPVFFALWQVFLRLVQLKGESFLWIKDLTLPDHLFKLPFTIPFLGDYFNLIPVLMVVLSLLQQKMTSPAAPEQKNMMLFMSVFMGVIFWNFPSSMALYWFIQNLLTFAYQLRTRSVQPALVKA
ncbi:MAG: YidC/Oxa1 family insertase periplasmic-domain containing protein [Candidatus Omnitrophota bacterium]|nr:YidC/Oxa1 family insertase periplasmic-domain containing protein [Candidatus Omnitrophota bacterium]